MTVLKMPIDSQTKAGAIGGVLWEERAVKVYTVGTATLNQTLRTFAPPGSFFTRNRTTSYS